MNDDKDYRDECYKLFHLPVGTIYKLLYHPNKDFEGKEVVILSYMKNVKLRTIEAFGYEVALMDSSSSGVYFAAPPWLEKLGAPNQAISWTDMKDIFVPEGIKNA